MPKQIEDIIAGEKRSIRDIPIPDNRRKTINLIENEPFEPLAKQPSQITQLPKVSPKEESPVRSLDSIVTADIISNLAKDKPAEADTHFEAPKPRDFSPPKQKRNLPKKPIIFGVIGLVVFLTLGIFSLVSGATITYKPKTLQTSFSNEIYPAKRSGLPGELLFHVIKISSEESAEAPASGEKQVSEKASGIIIVYNNSDTSPQKLIKNTRFETADGKVYRVQNDISVPGKINASGNSVPGSLEVSVYADQPGDSYNIGLSDFTLPGLKGDPKFSTIYARSKTPMSGGLIGTVKNVSAEDKLKAETAIEESLRNNLLIKARADMPADFVLLPNLSQTTFEKLPEGQAEGDKAVVRVRGNYSALIFKKSDLANYLTSKKTALSPSETVNTNFDELDVNFVKLPAGDLASIDNTEILVNGNALMMWISDEAQIAQDVVGKGKDQLELIMQNYPSVIDASAVIKPLWKSSFPEDVSKIKFVKEL
ncbi:MAG: hypothetical protein M3Q24_02000 [bacterium]|nr:hypothetical protein [bacterium]